MSEFAAALCSKTATSSITTNSGTRTLANSTKLMSITRSWCEFQRNYLLRLRIEELRPKPMRIWKWLRSRNVWRTNIRRTSKRQSVLMEQSCLKRWNPSRASTPQKTPLNTSSWRFPRYSSPLREDIVRLKYKQVLSNIWYGNFSVGIREFSLTVFHTNREFPVERFRTWWRPSNRWRVN